jgi:FixJ family two-component response regulator
MQSKTIVAPSVSHQPRVLVVDDEPNLVELINDVVSRQINGRMIVASTVQQAQQILQTQPIELMVTDLHLPDGDGMDLLAELQSQQPHASAIIITGAPTMDGAISAIRRGALDFLPKPFSAEHLAERVRRALTRQARHARTEKRLERLRDAISRLNESRKLVSRKVDLLCNDLVSAYGELSRQLDSVRTQDGFRQCLREARDLEQLLCHAMDWMLRQLGYSNIAIWLSADEEDYQLGAYMKYTMPGEQHITDAIRDGLVRLAVQRQCIHLRGDQVEAQLTAEEFRYLGDQEIAAVNCTYLGDSLAVLVLFRERSAPFSDLDIATLQAIAPIFAVTLASIVKGPGHAADSDEGWPDEDDRRGEDGEWWKRGEPPPF